MNQFQCPACGATVVFHEKSDRCNCSKCLQLLTRPIIKKIARPLLYPRKEVCINPDCGKEYEVKKWRLSKVCFECAGNRANDFRLRRGYYYRTWLKGFREYAERIEKGEYDERT